MLSFSTEAGSQLQQRQLLEELYSQRQLHAYSKGDTIPIQPEEVWIVYRGVVQLSTIQPSGDEVFLGLVGPTMPFGLSFTTLDPYFATALSNLDLLRLTLADLEESAALSQAIFRYMTRRLRQTEAMLALSGYRRVEERLRQLLLLLKDEVGQPVADGTCLSVKLTHQQLANALGTTRVTVTRTLQKLRAEQWIKLDRNRQIIVTAQASLLS